MTMDEEPLRTSPLLVGLADEEFEVLVGMGERRCWSAGERIVAEGTPSDALFILLRGAVRVEKGEPGSAVVLTVLKEPGDFFGEMSLIDILPRSAHVRAVEETELLVLPKKVLSALFTQFPRVQTTMVLNIARNLSLRLREADARIVELERAASARRGD